MKKYRDSKTPFVLEWVGAITTQLNSPLYLDLMEAGWSATFYKNDTYIMKNPTAGSNLL